MILYEKDWAEFPSAIADYNTPNKSFLTYAALLKAMGVKNNAFCLALFQPELVGVDPHSPDLTRDQKKMIYQECCYNPWYFFREVFRIPPIAGIDPVSYIANRANISMMWAFLNHVDYLLIQPRQTGKSVSTDGLSSWLYLFAMRNSKMLLITKDDGLRSDNVIRLRNMRGYLPKWLIVDDRTDANNTQMVTYNTLGNVYRTAVGQNSEDGALKIGRGGTVPFMHIDEGPFINYADIMIPAASSAMNAAKDEAAKNGLPYGIVFTTTAGKIDSRSGRYFYEEIYRKSAVWDEAYYDFPDQEYLHKVIRVNSGNRDRAEIDKSKVGSLSICGVWSHRQLGYDDIWLYKKMSESRSVGDAAERDYLNRWTSGGLSSPFTNIIASAIMASERNHDHIAVSNEGYVTRWYIPEETKASHLAKTHIAIGVDTSDAIGRDGISVVMTDQQDLAVVAVATVNETNLIKAARWVAGILIDNPNSTLVIEKRSSAQTFIDTCIMILHANGIDPLKRIFNRVVDLKSTRANDWYKLKEFPQGRRNDVFYDQFRKDFGFNTTGASRDLLYSQVMLNAVKHSAALIRDRTLSEELRGLEMRNGRIDHAVGGHDDTVIAWLLTHWFFMFARNLEHYGVDPRKMMLKVGKDGSAVTPAEAAERDRKEQMVTEIEALSEKLKNTEDAYIVLVTETKLKKLFLNLGPTEDSLSLDSILKQTREHRLKRKEDRRRQLRRAA